MMQPYVEMVCKTRIVVNFSFLNVFLSIIAHCMQMLFDFSTSHFYFERLLREALISCIHEIEVRGRYASFRQ